MAANARCFVCNVRNPRMNYLRGEEMAEVRNLAIQRRIENQLPVQDVDNNSRICLGCRRSIAREIELRNNPYAFRFRVLRSPPNNLCFLCNVNEDLHVLSIECKIEVYINCEILIPEHGVRCCSVHLDDRGFILRPLLEVLPCRNRLYLLTPEYLQRFLRVLPEVTKNNWQFNDIYDFNDDEVRKLTSLTKPQFEILFDYCDDVPRDGGGHYRIHRKDLLMFLCKLRQGISDEFLTVMFKYSTRQATSLAVANVRKSLMIRFVPENLGLNAITRDRYIAEHVPIFHQSLYNPGIADEPRNLKAIAYADGTYTFIFKSSNFRSLRQSFCTHKSRHLIKPALLVAPDGYILDVHGPFFSDAPNNDASMLEHQLNNDDGEILHWFQRGDIFILDRGYRDVVDILEQHGYECRIPPFLEAGENQLPTDEANESRLITKTRWIVEARNGHIKLLFKYLAQIQQIHVSPHIGDFYRIAAALINRFRGLIHMENADEGLAQRMLERAALPNVVQDTVEVEEMARRNAQRWMRLDEGDLQDFPVLTMEFLKDVTVGIYQVNLAPGYVQDKLQRDDDQEFQVEMQHHRNHIPIPGLLRIRVYSRFQNRTSHQLWIDYVPNGNLNDPRRPPIRGYYCTCKCGARTLGTCAHVASALWYLGYARHQDNVRYPSMRLLEEIEDAGMRPPQINPE